MQTHPVTKEAAVAPPLSAQLMFFEGGALGVQLAESECSRSVLPPHNLFMDYLGFSCREEVLPFSPKRLEPELKDSCQHWSLS